MTIGTPLPFFEHDPLPEHTSHFRLLHIVRGDFGQHVECEISVWPIDNAPPYYAISYTWGDPAHTTEITVNGRPLIVRCNCEYVLQQAFVSKKSRYFWVDAICIAQTTEEKNHQVGIMSRIYEEAKHVFACVGPHENDSEFLPEIIKEYRSLLKSIGEVEEDTRIFGEKWRNPIQYHNRLLLRCLLSIKPKSRERLYRSFCSFIQRPYFNRLWVIQELKLAQRVSYCFGVAVEAAQDFLALYRLLNIWDNPLHFGSKNKLVSKLTNRVQSIVASYQTESSRAMQSKLKSLQTSVSRLHTACTAEKQTVRNIVLDRNMQCTDPRDRLFGILSVARLPNNIPVTKPDYTKDRFEVALEALRLINTPAIASAYDDAERLCHSFQVTGEENSLRNALALRCSTLQPEPRSDYGVFNSIIKPDKEWESIKISADLEDLGLLKPVSGDKFSMYVSAGEYEGCRTLHLAGVLEKLSIPAPSGARCGDLWLFEHRTIRKPLAVGFVVRKSEHGKYNLIGQTISVQRDYAKLQAACRGYARKGLECCWYPEDALLLGWTLKKLEPHRTSRHQISKFVNQRICAWEGSSYFRKIKERKFPQSVYSSDSSVPLLV